MRTQTATKSTDYAYSIAELVAKMPIERAEQVYDFVRFLQTQHTQENWLSDSEEQMQAEDTLWEATYAEHKGEFDALAEAARSEIESEATQPMFDEHGEYKRLLRGDGSLQAKN